jgi:hypothetical protein
MRHLKAAAQIQDRCDAQRRSMLALLYPEA